MCAEIEIGNKVIETIGELVALVGRENIVIDSLYLDVKGINELDREFCLCPVDIPATALKAGYVSENPDVSGEDWHMGYRWKKRNSPNYL